MSIPVPPIEGKACFFSNASYNCPALKLYGYSTDRALAKAIRRKLSTLTNV